jgi:hypothetical protein
VISWFPKLAFDRVNLYRYAPEEHGLDFEEDMANDELQAELASVERSLQAKESKMRAMSSAAQKMQAEVDIATASRGGGAGAGGGGGGAEQHDVEELREKYGRLLQSLESEKTELAAERDGLLAALAAAAKQGDDVRKEVEKKNRGRLAELEKRLKEVQKLEGKHREAARLRAKSDQAATALQADIQRLRAARVELVRRMERTAKDGITKQRDAERALQAARKDGRRHAAAAQKAQAAVDRQAAVLRRKTEEAANAREQLRSLQAAARANHKRKPAAAAAAALNNAPAVVPAAAKPGSTTESDKAGPGTGLGLGGRKAWLEAELAAAVERAELRASLDETLARRAALGRRFPHLATPGKASPAAAAFARTPGPPTAAWGAEAKTPCASGAGGAGGGDDEAVEEELRAVTEQIAALQERVVRSEEREEVRGGMRRWARVRSLGEARSLLTMLFNSAAAARRKVNAGEGTTAGGAVLAVAAAAVGAAAAALPAVAATPGGNKVLDEADAVLMQLNQMNKTASKLPKNPRTQPRVRPPWQAVGPTSLLPKGAAATEEEAAAAAAAVKDDKPADKSKSKGKKIAFAREADDLEEEDVDTSDSELEEDDDVSESEDPEHDPEWNENCQTPAVIGGRTRRAAAAASKPAAAAPKEAVAKKGPACTVCTQMFDKRVEGHQKSHKRCPFFFLYVMDKEMKQLEEQGEGAEEELEAKKAEHKSELCRLKKGAQDGSIRPPGDAEEEVEDGAADADAGCVVDGPDSHPVSAPNSASSSEEEASTTTSGGGDYSGGAATPATASGGKVEVPLSELITTCRNARRRAEGLLHASGGGAPHTAGRHRSPFGDVSNDSFPGSAAASAAVRKRMSFGASGFGGAVGAFQAPGVTAHRGCFGGAEADSPGGEGGFVEDEFRSMNADDL